MTLATAMAPMLLQPTHPLFVSFNSRAIAQPDSVFASNCRSEQTCSRAREDAGAIHSTQNAKPTNSPIACCQAHKRKNEQTNKRTKNKRTDKRPILRWRRPGPLRVPTPCAHSICTNRQRGKASNLWDAKSTGASDGADCKRGDMGETMLPERRTFAEAHQ
jgi:hypothetical protein